MKISQSTVLEAVCLRAEMQVSEAILHSTSCESQVNQACILIISQFERHINIQEA